MKKIILIVLLFMFTSSVTAFAEVVEQCPAGPCSDGFESCVKTILKSDDNGKTKYTETVHGCCKESCGCPELGQKQSPDGKVCCPKDSKFIENADWQACTYGGGCVSTYGCCPEGSGGTYVSGYKLCGGEYLPLQACCSAGEKPIENMGVDDDSGQPIDGCCPVGSEPYIMEVGKWGPQKGCCPEGMHAYGSAVKPRLETCCPEDSVVQAYKDEDVCCPSGKPNLHETETSYLCCAAGEQVAKNDQKEEVCCPKDKIVNGICGGDCPEGCSEIVSKGETICCCDMDEADLPEGATAGVVKKKPPKDDDNG